ncbi:hypothetical protein C2G38_2291253 [Gigaspora rosea]|uniref:HAT C-terminal dimerisation domain-containing protein n=1 Tax=Gigaspora rosea TaxID=44941 RepID=A0A397U4X4_9GLOM|nr:hypothetical protein C2G38_2291253 [Gigaspora rosea]
MRNMYWLVENNIATFNIQDLCSLVEMQIQNKEEYIISTSAYTIRSVFLNTTVLEERCKYGSYSNNHAEHDFIEAIAQVIEESTIKELSKSLTWSIMIDESTTITNHKNLVIVSKHLVNNIPCYRYLGMIQLTSGTANSITSELLHFFTAKNIPTKALNHMGSDGASVMLGIEIPAIINGIELLNEWAVFRSLLYNFQNFKLYEAWENIFKIENFKSIYPNISMLASLLLTLPLSNAYVERVFSYQNNIKTKLRKNMSLKTLNDLIIISLNRPS